MKHLAVFESVRSTAANELLKELPMTNQDHVLGIVVVEKALPDTRCAKSHAIDPKILGSTLLIKLRMALNGYATITKEFDTRVLCSLQWGVEDKFDVVIFKESGVQQHLPLDASHLHALFGECRVHINPEEPSEMPKMFP